MGEAEDIDVRYLSAKDRERWAALCCNGLRAAFEWGTDAEMCSSLCVFGDEQEWRFLSSVADPKFCPWCGTPVKTGEA
jgi:hypothetical protein